MSKQTINIGASPNDGTGTPLRTSFDYTNQNFTELYTAVGPSGNNIVVPGSATITGDLTVATDAFKVISATKDVCIGTVTPTFNNKLTVVGGGGGDAFITSGNGTRTGYIGTDGTYVIMGGYSNHSVQIHANDIAQMRIAPLGVFEWFDGASGTRMTLNATGLGIGVAPVADCKLTVRGGSLFDRGVGGGSPQLLLAFAASSGANYGQISNTGTRWALGFGTTLTTVGTEALVWDSSGNVGIGLTPSTAWNTGTNLQVGVQAALYSNSALGAVDLSSNSVRTGNDTYQYLLAGSNQASRFTQRDGAFRWFSAAAGTSPNAITFGDAKMTLDASGNLLVGTTSSLPSFADGRIEVLAAASSYCIVADATATSAAAIGIRGNDSTVAASFYNASTGGTVGSIVINSGGVSYNTTSDYRLKESVKPISGGLARVNALKPSIYNWKSNGSTGEGFIAHELAEVVPFAVSGEKDAMNADGTIKSQGIDMSRIVPILVAAIQELTAEVNALKNA